MAVVEKQMDQYSKVPTSEFNEKSQEQEIPAHTGWGVRHSQLVLFTAVLCVSFIARSHMGVTMVAMTRDRDTHTGAGVSQPGTAGTTTNVPHANTTAGVAMTRERDMHTGASVSQSGTAGTSINVSHAITTVADANDTGVRDLEWFDEGNVTIERLEDSVITIYRSYEWEKPVQEMVLNAFFLGYALMMFPMGLVCQRWGGKIPLQVSMLVNGLVSAVMPWLALWGGWKAVCACRVVQGGTQAGTYPSIQVLLAKWVPANEKATLSSYLYTGTTIGTVIGFQLGGVLSELGGWPVTCWTVGGLCLASLALLSMLGAASPGDHATISRLEANYIRGRIVNTNDIKVRRKTPWKAIFTCKPMWANFATHIGSIAAFNFISAQVPSYIHYILNVDVKNSGLLSSLPYVASAVPSLGLGLVSDYLTNNNIVSVKNARRISNSIAQIGVAASLIGASFATSTSLCVICFIITISCHSGIHAGWMVNHIDLAPNFSATMMALGNTMSNIVVTLLPVVVSYVVTDVTNVFQWRIMLSLVAAMCFLTNIVFVLFVSTAVQPWNEGATEEDDHK